MEHHRAAQSYAAARLSSRCTCTGPVEVELAGALSGGEGETAGSGQAIRHGQLPARRQPAATASASLQNQRWPADSSIRVAG
jgi:hypothetical protein